MTAINSNFDGDKVTLLANKMISNFDNTSVMSKLCVRDLSTEFKQYGDVVQLIKPGSISVGNYTGADLTFTDPAVTTDTLTLNQVKQATFQIDRIDKTNTKHDLNSVFRERMRIAIGLTVDTHLLDTAAAGVDSGNVLGTTSAPIQFTKDNVLEFLRMGKLEIKSDNVDTSKLAFVTTPEVASWIVEAVGERETSKGDEALSMGKVTSIYGIDIYETTNLAAASGVFSHMLFNPNIYLDHVMRIPPDTMEVIPTFEKNFKMGVKVLFYYGSKVFHPVAGFKYLSVN